MTEISGRTALVTGGASGIGLLTGQRMLERGLKRLLVWDVSQSNIEAARTRLGEAAQFLQVDVTNVDAIEEAVSAAETAGTHIDILINNAGIVVGKPFRAHSRVDIDRTLQINAAAPMHLARAVLPGMLRRKEGHIVNIASAAGMVSNPNMSAYCGSKWAVIGWSESLRLEMELTGSGIRITTVAPYYIDTGMFSGVRSPILPILKPEHAARQIVRAIEKDRILLRMPGLVNLLPLARGVMPTRAFDLLFGRVLGIYRTMDHFRGRQ